VAPGRSGSERAHERGHERSGAATATPRDKHPPAGPLPAHGGGGPSASLTHGRAGSSGRAGKEVCEWVACDACSKWRQLPPNVNPSSLPDQVSPRTGNPPPDSLSLFFYECQFERMRVLSTFCPLRFLVFLC
jgi:hypothetical protein